MYISKKASRARQREAQNARDNRAEIVKALSIGQITKRDLFKWGIYTTTGALALKNGLSPFARSAFADDIPTGTPRSPLGTATKFSQPMPRLALQPPYHADQGSGDRQRGFPGGSERTARQAPLLSHRLQANPIQPGIQQPGLRTRPDRGTPAGRSLRASALGRVLPQGRLCDDLGPGRGGHPIPSRHGGAESEQRLDLRHRPVRAGQLASVPDQGPLRRTDPDPHLQQHAAQPRRRTGASAATRASCIITTRTTAPRATAPPTCTTSPARSTTIAGAPRSPGATRSTRGDRQPRVSGPNGNGGLVRVAGDFRELQGTLWAHDHRFFFTAENVYKGNLGMVNYYSGPDRGNEALVDGVNLRLPSGRLLDYGNVDFDVNLIVSDAASSRTASCSSTPSPPTASSAMCRW